MQKEKAKRTLAEREACKEKRKADRITRFRR
jgi:hypothetical protein